MKDLARYIIVSWMLFTFRIWGGTTIEKLKLFWYLNLYNVICFFSLQKLIDSFHISTNQKSHDKLLSWNWIFSDFSNWLDFFSHPLCTRWQHFWSVNTNPSMLGNFLKLFHRLFPPFLWAFFRSLFLEFFLDQSSNIVIISFLFLFLCLFTQVLVIFFQMYLPILPRFLFLPSCF